MEPGDKLNVVTMVILKDVCSSKRRKSIYSTILQIYCVMRQNGIL